MSNTNLNRIAIVFSGGPAPAANAVISTAAASFLNRAGKRIEVIGIRHGYSSLINYPNTPLKAGEAYVEINNEFLRRTRNSQGILLGTARANPGEFVRSAEDLTNPEKNQRLQAVYDALSSLGVNALISIGGDDTLTTAYKFNAFQEKQNLENRIRVVHVPKTIDNDIHHGIDFTFGYFTAVHTLADEIRTLLYDAEATRSYFVAETMGRSSGWIAYGAAIAGEASMTFSVEDLLDDRKSEQFLKRGVEDTTLKPGETIVRDVMDMDAVLDWIQGRVEARAARGKQYGVLVLAEGLAEYLPSEYLGQVEFDKFGHLRISSMEKSLARIFAEKMSERLGGKKVTGVTLGYESRCAVPHAFDVVLGSQLGVGAFRALTEDATRNAVMVSVSGPLDLHYVPFTDLVDEETLVAKVRRVNTESDFHKLVRFLESGAYGADAG